MVVRLLFANDNNSKDGNLAQSSGGIKLSPTPTKRSEIKFMPYRELNSYMQGSILSIFSQFNRKSPLRTEASTIAFCHNILDDVTFVTDFADSLCSRDIVPGEKLTVPGTTLLYKKLIINRESEKAKRSCPICQVY